MFFYDSVGELSVVISHTDVGGLANISEESVKSAIETLNNVSLE
jgi:hypothetical protein